MLELQGTEMVFLPSLEFGVPDGFYDLVDGLVGDIYKQAALIKRLAAHSGQVSHGLTSWKEYILGEKMELVFRIK